MLSFGLSYLKTEHSEKFKFPSNIWLIKFNLGFFNQAVLPSTLPPILLQSNYSSMFVPFSVCVVFFLCHLSIFLVFCKFALLSINLFLSLRQLFFGPTDFYLGLFVHWSVGVLSFLSVLSFVSVCAFIHESACKCVYLCCVHSSVCLPVMYRQSPVKSPDIKNVIWN